MVGQPRHFIQRVTDVEHGNLQLAVQALQIRQNILLAAGIERGERLIHQQQARTSQQRPSDGDTLAFATGELRRVVAFDQTAQSQPFHHLLGMHFTFDRHDALIAIFQVGAHRQMRKQARLLKHITQRSLVCGQEPRVILPHFAIQAQHPGSAFKPRNAA